MSMTRWATGELRKWYVKQDESGEGKAMTKIEYTLYKLYKNSYTIYEYLYVKDGTKWVLDKKSLDSVITIRLRYFGYIKKRCKDGLS